ncbi:MAG: ssDNA-binding protein [Eubacterium sp.]
MARINAAIEAAKQKGATDKWNGIVPPVVPTPVYDGDGVRPSDGMAFSRMQRVLGVYCQRKGGLSSGDCDANMNPIINQTEIYSGIYARVNVNFFPYAFGGKKGIGCGLGPVQKLSDGEALGGSAPTAAQAFGAAQPQASPVQPPARNVQPARPKIDPITGLPM